MNAGFLADELRRADYDMYLQTLFYKGVVRERLQALASFNCEIARTRSMVTDTNLGLIRLQWWRDEICKIYHTKTYGQIPQLSTLAPLMIDGTLPLNEFETLLFAREFDLEDVPPASATGLQNYADFITSPLNRLALGITDETDEPDNIQRVSVDFGKIEIIRSVPFMLSQERCLLPEDLLTVRNLSAQKIINYNHKADISDIIKEVCGDMIPHQKCKSAWLKRQSAMTGIYLKRLKKFGFDVFSPDFNISPPFLALRMAMA